MDMLDLSGRRVGSLLDCHLDEGNHSITWKKETGNGIDSGLYICVVQVQQKDLSEIRQIKMIVQ
jgi:hypothetical protein